MAYERHIWYDGEIITALKLNNIEGGVQKSLPAYGGYLTGAIIYNGDDQEALVNISDTTNINIRGGTDDEDGASLILRGIGQANTNGWFELHTGLKDNSQSILIGKPDGTLLWNGKDISGEDVLTIDRGGTGASSTTAALKNLGALPLAGGTMTGALVNNSSITANSLISKTGIEIYHSTTPFIDFHYGNSTADYTSRIIESSLGTLSIIGNLKIQNTLTVSSTLTASAGITGELTGNASTATSLKTARNITVGNATKSFNGTTNISMTLDEIGAAPKVHTHDYLPLSGGTLTGALIANSNITVNGQLITNSSIEIKSATPFIDFHYNNSTADYTSRIIENSSGVLTITGALIVNNGITGKITQAANADYATKAGTATLAPSYLPLSGGTMEGVIYAGGVDTIIKNASTSKSVNITGGTELENGANLILRGCDQYYNGSYLGNSFELWTCGASGGRALRGYQDSSLLSWSGKTFKVRGTNDGFVNDGATLELIPAVAPTNGSAHNYSPLGIWHILEDDLGSSGTPQGIKLSYNNGSSIIIYNSDSVTYTQEIANSIIKVGEPSDSDWTTTSTTQTRGGFEISTPWGGNTYTLKSWGTALSWRDKEIDRIVTANKSNSKKIWRFTSGLQIIADHIDTGASSSGTYTLAYAFDDVNAYSVFTTITGTDATGDYTVRIGRESTSSVSYSTWVNGYAATEIGFDILCIGYSSTARSY